MYIPLPSKVHIPQTKGGARAYALMWRIKHVQNGICLTPTWREGHAVIAKAYSNLEKNRSGETEK